MIDQSGFDEHSKRQSEIKDMNVSTLKSLLTFIYTNKIVSNNIPDLFAMADMYDIQVQKTFLQSWIDETFGIQRKGLVKKFKSIT